MRLFEPYQCSSIPDGFDPRDMRHDGGDRPAAMKSRHPDFSTTANLDVAVEKLELESQDSYLNSPQHVDGLERESGFSVQAREGEQREKHQENGSRAIDQKDKKPKEHPTATAQRDCSPAIHIDPSLAASWDSDGNSNGGLAGNGKNGHGDGHGDEKGQASQNNGNGKSASPGVESAVESASPNGASSEARLAPTESGTAIAPPPAPSVKPETRDEAINEGLDEALDIGFVPVLKNFDFLALWSGQVFSQLADKVYLVLMIAIISSRFQASGQSISGWVSALMIVFTIPAVLFGFAAGVFVDHWSKKTVLVATNLLRGGLVLALPLLIWMSDGGQLLYGIPLGFFMLLGVTFLVSTLTQFFAPAEQAAIPLIVPKKHLLSANSLYTTTMMASVIVGFALGEPLLELTDTLVARVSPDLSIGKELLVGISYAVAGLLLLLVRLREKNNRSDREKPHFWVDMRDGLDYLGGHHKVRAALIQLVILFSVFAALAVLAVRLAELIPTIDSDQFGFLLAAAGVGMAIGATLVGQFGQQFRRSLLSLVGSIGMAICLGLLSLFTQNLWPALICIGLFGGCASLVGIPMQTTIQAETPEDMRGKVFGLQNNAVNIALSLPLALAGIAETLLGLQTVLLGLSTILLLGGLLTWYSSPMRSTQPDSKDH